MMVRIFEVEPQTIRFWAHGDEHVLANNINVSPVAGDMDGEPNFSSIAGPLNGCVIGLSPACPGTERRWFWVWGCSWHENITSALGYETIISQYEWVKTQN